jgi:glycosyltransferase involved in cell wall biosynthesis
MNTYFILKAKRLIRFVISFSPILGIVKKPIDKNNGISVFVRVKDEEDWLKYSILSIRDFADEIIVGDNGSQDKSVDIVQNLIDQGLNIRLFKCPDMKINELTNFLLKKTHYRWVMKWDADFIARTTGEHSILNLRHKLLNMDRNRYYLIMLSHICLSGDLHHQNPDELTHTEEYIYTNSDCLTFIHPGTCESLKSPKYYAVIKFDGHYSFHVDVKSASRMLARRYWFDWMELKDYLKFPTLSSYVDYRVRNENQLKSVQEAELHFVIEACKRLVPYDDRKFGEYPEILKEELYHPKYRIIYKDGKILGRNDILASTKSL